MGNSTVGLAVWEPGAEGPVAVEQLSDATEAGTRVAGRRAAVISVAPTRLAAFLATAGPGAVVVDRPAIPLAASSLAETTGADRFAVVTAALPGPAVCVDAGTAVTVDVLDRDGVYRGGFIGAGPATMRAGLAQRAEALPEGGGEAVPLEPGLDTANALAAGSWGMCVGGVDRLVSEAIESLAPSRGELVAVLVTGGWGEAYLEASRRPRDHAEVSISFDPHLVHRGIRAWARRRWARPGS